MLYVGKLNSNKKIIIIIKNKMPNISKVEM